MKQKLVITTLAICLLAGGSLTANARNLDGAGYGPQTMSESDSGQNDWRGGQRHNRRDMVADLIGLSEDQQTQITAIRDEERSNNVTQREKMQEYREQIWALTDAGTFDEQAVRAIAEAKAEIQIEMAVARARMHSKIHAIMTPEQQELATKLRSVRKGRGGKSQRGQGGGGRR